MSTLNRNSKVENNAGQLEWYGWSFGVTLKLINHLVRRTDAGMHWEEKAKVKVYGRD